MLLSSKENRSSHVTKTKHKSKAVELVLSVSGGCLFSMCEVLSFTTMATLWKQARKREKKERKKQRRKRQRS
jgi:hypothetical protein